MEELENNSAALSSLADLAVTIFEQTETLVHVNMWGSRIPAEGGTRILETFSGSSIAKLAYVNMSTNKSWFSSVDNCVLLGDFLTRQPQLQEMHMGYNFFSSEATYEFLLQLSQAPALETIQKIDL